MAQYNSIFCTTCAVHYMNFMLEDIFQLPNMKKTFKKVMVVNNYIYAHPSIVNMFRQFTDKKKLFRPAKIIFVTTFITLEIMHSLKKKLRSMVIFCEWTTSKWAKETMDKKGFSCTYQSFFSEDYIICFESFWSTCSITPFSYSEKKLAMGYIYEVMIEQMRPLHTLFKVR